jgi:hypothetical protein
MAAAKSGIDFYRSRLSKDPLSPFFKGGIESLPL